MVIVDARQHEDVRVCARDLAHGALDVGGKLIGQEIAEQKPGTVALKFCVLEADAEGVRAEITRESKCDQTGRKSDSAAAVD